MLGVSEIDIENAFTDMCHKLRDNSRFILVPVISRITKLQDMNNRTNKRLMELNQDIAKFNNKLHTLNRLREQDILDNEIYIAQQASVVKEIQRAKDEKARVISNNGDDTLENTKMILNAVNTINPLNDTFSPIVFSNIIKRVNIGQDSITFILINGLELKETLQRKGR